MPEPPRFRFNNQPERPKRTAYEDSADRRESAAFYGSRQWKELRDRIRQQEPLCRQCLSEGIIRLGQAIDHIKPRKQYPELSLDPGNLRNLCNSCHNKVRTQQNNTNHTKL